MNCKKVFQRRKTTTTTANYQKENDDDDEIARTTTDAVQSLDRGIRELWARYDRRQKNGVEEQHELELEERRRRRHIQHIVRHIQQCWTRLRHQVRALSAGLECYQQRLLPSVTSHIRLWLEHHQQLNQPSTTTPPDALETSVTQTLLHLFQWLLRLHDGQILTVSGECRHESDAAMARQQQQESKSNAFVSQLNKPNYQQQRDKNGKGQTKQTTPTNTTSSNSSVLYSSQNTYSGTSWDEWMDQERGLRSRLFALLRPYLPNNKTNHGLSFAEFWDDWTEPGQPAALLEAIVTQTEQDMQTIQSQFTALCHPSKLAHQLRQALLDIIASQPSNSSNNLGKPASVSVTLHWNDKMEKLMVRSAALFPRSGTLTLERHANKFQIPHGCTSVLPTAFTTPHHWWTEGGMQWWEPVKQKLPPPNLLRENNNNNTDGVRKKRRKVIEESSSSSDDEPQKKVVSDSIHTTEHRSNNTVSLDRRNALSSSSNSTSNATSAVGLVVKMGQSLATKKKGSIDDDIALNAIKMRCGVNISDREAAFDNLQAEEANASRAAALVDDIPVDGDMDAVNLSIRPTMEEDWFEEIGHAERRVRQRKRDMKAAVDADYIDLEEVHTAIWNAREMLREALMHAGDLLLWSAYDETDGPPSANTNKNSFKNRQTYLSRSIQYFDEAHILVAAQQELHARMHEDINHLSDNDRFFRRNLMLLNGQALTNNGIARIELFLHLNNSRVHPRGLTKGGLLSSACEKLDDAIMSTRALKHQASTDASVFGNNAAETSMDTLQALQLESLALRWKATALWHSRKRTEATSTFRAAAGVVDLEIPLSLDQEELVDAAVDCHIECYHAMTTLADLTLQSIKLATAFQIRESSALFDGLMTTAATAIQKAATSSKTIESELKSDPDKLADFREKHSILTPQELSDRMRADQEWWNRKKTASAQSFEKNSSHVSVALLPRSDLLAHNGSLSSDPVPTGRYVVDPRARARRKSKFNLGGVGFSNIGTSSHIEEDIEPVTQPCAPKYRKWREDMTMDLETGMMVPKLVYPSIAPEMPAHIIAILAARRSTSVG